MPKVTDHFRGAAPRVIDPVSGAVSESGKTLSWNAANVAGGMVVPYDEALPMTNFTFEAMIRLPPNAESGRDTPHGGKMFPIAQFGRDQKAGWILQPAGLFPSQRTRQGFLLSNFHPGIRYCMPMASFRAPRQFSI